MRTEEHRLEEHRLDHLVYATDNLDRTCSLIADALGVRPTPGGQHTGRGTRNYLLSLGNGGYLEIIGPDPDQPEPDGSRPFGVDEIVGERLVTWAVSTADIHRSCDTLLAVGVDPGPPTSMQRKLPDGSVLSWHLTTPFAVNESGIVPFLIDWGIGARTGPTHPSMTAPTGVSVVSLSAFTPRLHLLVHAALEALGLSVPLAEPPPNASADSLGAGGLTAVLDGPRGRFILSP